MVDHGFATASDALTAQAAVLWERMLGRGVDANSQLRTLFLLGRLRDAAVAEWMLAGSTELGVMGRNSRNAAVAL